MKKQLEQQEALLQNQEVISTQMGKLYERGLIKGNAGTGYEIVATMEERDLILQQRREEEERTQQLNMEVNQNPPPSIGSDRQKVGQQLDFSEPPIQQNQKQYSGIPNIRSGVQSRKAAA